MDAVSGMAGKTLLFFRWTDRVRVPRSKTCDGVAGEVGSSSSLGSACSLALRDDVVVVVCSGRAKETGRIWRTDSFGLESTDTGLESEQEGVGCVSAGRAAAATAAGETIGVGDRDLGVT